MHLAELTPAEQRVLGCLIEKRWTTPDQYPLSLNGLRLACNQSTNRDPVTAYDESTVREAAQRLCKYGLARLTSGHGSRAIKYRHLAEEALGLGREELAVLAVLLLRGPQTPGELKARTERMAPLASLEDVDRVLSALIERGYARRIGRRPGQKEDRFQQLLGGGGGADGVPAGSAPAPAYREPPAYAESPAHADSPPPAYGESPATAYEESPPPAYRESPPPAYRESPAPAYDDSPAPAYADSPAADYTDSPATATPPPPATDNGTLSDRVAALEAEVAALRADLDALLG